VNGKTGFRFVMFLSVFYIFSLLSASMPGAQTPATLRLTAKLRDFLEINPVGKGPQNQDFNNDKFQGCSDTGYVSRTIRTTGDVSLFPNDNRTPTLVKLNRTRDGKPCYNSTAMFEDWFNDRDSTLNRPFLMDLDFKQLANGMYEFKDGTFFPLDDVPEYRAYPGSDLKPFGQLQTCCAHNYGFTMEFHSPFTYLAGKNQLFNFSGDDDVWVYINGQLVIDLGGQHAALDASANLDSLAVRLGLVDHESYLLDFFFAERHVVGSNCKITTSLELGAQKVSTPVATPPGSTFNSQVAVSLDTPTPGAVIYYSVDGSVPDSNGLVFDRNKPIPITSTTVVRAIAYKQGWAKSEVMTETYTRNFVASTLEILDENGNPPAGGYLSERNTSYSIKLSTTQAGLAVVTPGAVTRIAGDQENLSLSNPANQGDNLVYSGKVPLSIAAAAAGNGKTEAAGYDTLTLSWTNPLDPRDVAVGKMPIRPYPQQARAYFSTKADGSDTTDQYAGTETVLYLFVLDQALPASSKPTVALETTPKNGSGRSKDAESLNLETVAPGIYRAAISVDINPASAAGDGKLQLALEDLIKATYLDPMDAENPAIANAGYGIAPEIDASLRFTDKAGNPLPNGIYYNPAEGVLYLTYSDDWVNGQIKTKTVTLTVENNFGKAGADLETFTLDLALAKRKGSTGVWEGSLNLKDGPGIVVGDKIAETYVLGKVHAMVTSHNKQGSDLIPATDDLLVAYPNQDADLNVNGSRNTNVTIARDDPGLKITLLDQSLSAAKDTLYVSVRCTESKDGLANVMLIETDAGSGRYESAVIPKAEGAANADGVLQCLSRDEVKVSYDDPVYGNHLDVQAMIDDPVATRVYFTASAADTIHIGSVREGEATSFYAVVIASSVTVGKADTIWITFTTPQGEKENLPAVETGIYTGEYRVKVPFGFTVDAVKPGNGAVEGKLSGQDADNRVIATGSVTIAGVETKGDILLISAFAPVVKAWIKDTDGDGAGDKVFVQFAKKPARLPATLDAQWNDTATVRKATAPKLSFLNGDSTVVVADYGADPFPAGKTSIAEGQVPRARLPADPFFAGQSPAIEDSIGPVILGAIKRPADVSNLSPGDPAYNYDTLVITLSEPLKASQDFREMIKFAPGCGDYGSAITLTAVNNPTAEANGQYTVIVDNSVSKTPQTGNCIFLNTDPGKYTDAAGNPPSQIGTPLKGVDRNRVIQVFRGYPPVSGLDASSPSYQVAVQDTRDPAKAGYAVNGGAVEWITPVGFDESAVRNGDGFHGYVPTDIKGAGTTDNDNNGIVDLPGFISAIQVVSTTRYVAKVNIFDNMGNFVKSFSQSFGYQGELANRNRVVPKGLVSFLVWDRKDAHGQLAGQGVYVWKVDFLFDSGKQEVQYTRTGLVR